MSGAPDPGVARAGRRWMPWLLLAYALLAGLWVFLDGRLAAWLIDLSPRLAPIAALEGWLFTVLALALPYPLAQGLWRSVARGRVPVHGAASPRSPCFPIALLAVAIALLTAGGILLGYQQHRGNVAARLLTIAELKTSQISAWLGERRGDAGFLRNTLLVSELDSSPDSEAGLRLAASLIVHLKEFARYNAFQGVMMLDAGGRPLWNSQGALHPLDARLVTAAKQAVIDQNLVHHGPYRDAAGAMHLDFLVPLSAYHDGRPGPLIVLHSDPGFFLHPLIAVWPIPTDTGEALLLRREGDRILVLNQLRHLEDGAAAAGRFDMPLATEDLLAARFIQDPSLLGRLQVGRDYRRAPVMGVARLVPETDWLLVVKIDLAEVIAEAAGSAVWILFAGLLALVMAVAVVVVIRQRQEIALADETARRLALIERSRDGILVVDHEHRIMEANHRFAEMLGYAPEELIGLRTWEYDALMSEADIRQGFAHLEDFQGTFESRHRRKDGSEYDVEVSVGGTDWGGEQMVLCICREIGERKQAEKLLREINQLFGEMSAIAHIGAWEYDPATGQGSWTDEVARIHGVDPARKADVDFGLSFFHGEHRARVERAIQDAMKEGCPYDLEALLVTVSGEEKWVRVLGRPIFEDGYLTRMRGSIQDIDALKRASEEVERYRKHLEELVSTRTTELRRQTQSLRAIIDNIPFMIWLKDAGGRFLALNRAKAEVCGRSIEDIIGKTDFDIWPPEVARDYRADDEEVMASRHQKTVEEIIPTQPPSLNETFKAPVLDADGTLLGLVGFSRDISARKETDRLRESARQAAETANRAKSAFLANMSHEIRTPMNAIIGLTYLMGQSGVTPEQAGRLSKIESAAKHLLAIVNDILDLSKIESGRMDLEQTDFSLQGLFEQVRSLIADQARSKGLVIRLDTGDVPPWLSGDPTRLRQALLNYAANAVKFTERGSVTLRARRLEDRAGCALVRFEVSDTGVGLQPDALPRLFTPFGQADVSTTRKYGGTGLGLAITRRLAELMGGEAGVESQFEVGSTFWFTACLGRGQDVVESPVSARPGDSTEDLLREHCSNARLLLAEDNLINREVALELLHAVNLAVDTAENGRLALDMLAERAYDLVLMDVQMPEMDGLEATRHIRADPAQAALPILAMTANAFEEDRQACLAAGMTDFVAKPVEPGALYAALLRWLPSRPGAPSRARTPGTDEGANPRDVERLSSIPGLNAERGLASVRGNRATYSRLLHLFVQHHAEDARRMRTQLDAGEREAAARIAHGLKGVAGNLGAERLAELAACLQAALRAEAMPDGIEPVLAEVEAAFGDLIEGIRPWAPPDEVRGLDPGWDPDRFGQALDELDRLLEEDNSRAIQCLRESAPLIGDLFGDAFEGFTHAVECFDFETARATLGLVRASLDLDGTDSPVSARAEGDPG